MELNSLLNGIKVISKIDYKNVDITVSAGYFIKKCNKEYTKYIQNSQFFNTKKLYISTKAKLKNN